MANTGSRSVVEIMLASSAHSGAQASRTPAGQALMEREPETFKPPKRYSVPNPAESVKVKVQIMQRVKGGRVHLAGQKKMTQIRARAGAARVAGARRDPAAGRPRRSARS